MAAMKLPYPAKVLGLGAMFTFVFTIAQMAAANPLTVSEAVSEALRSNPELHALEADIVAAKGGSQLEPFRIPS